MSLFGHHTKAWLDIEILGHDLTPETATEHAVATALLGLALVLMLYGAYALVRDLLRRPRKVVGK